MDKLDKAYEGLELLKAIGIPVSDEQLQKIKEMEKEYLETEIIPLLKQEIKPLVEKMTTRFSALINFIPGEDLEIKLVERPQGSSVTIPQEPPRGETTRSSSLGFSVHFPDGQVIKHANAKATLIESLQKMGLERVSAFKERTFKDYCLVDKRERTDQYNCQEYVDGWYVYINMSNETKMYLLSKVGEMLNINLKIVKDDGTNYTYPTSNSPKSSREYFSLNGSEPYNKRRLVYEAVKLYMKEHPMASFDDISLAFPDKLQGSYGVVKSLEWVKYKQNNGYDFYGRYAMEQDEILTSADGFKFVVCNQWGLQFPRFTEWVERTLGWVVEKV